MINKSKRLLLFFAAAFYLCAKQCFKEGTLVACLNENGEEVRKPIESIAVGTLVLPYDEETGEKKYKPVVQLFKNETLKWYHIFVNGEEIICTGGHPFYVPDFNKFVSSKDLKVGERLLLSDGKAVIINSIEIETLESPETTFNFEVEDFHTYYVSESNVLVHNSCKEVEAVAEKLGYSKVKGQQSHGQAIFTNKKAPRELRYITPDLDSHNGGYWKAASSIKNLGSKTTRSGTYDMFLRRIGL